MSINAINSVSLYEYYYSINQNKKKSSPLEDEMRKYGLVPTTSETINAAMLLEAKRLDGKEKNGSDEEVKSNRPWADLMYQLNIPFNDDPADDIEDIKEELTKLISGVSDEELEEEIADLENHVENLYIDYQQNNQGGIDNSSTISAQLNSLSMLNRATLL